MCITPGGKRDLKLSEGSLLKADNIVGGTSDVLDKLRSVHYNQPPIGGRNLENTWFVLKNRYA